LDPADGTFSPVAVYDGSGLGHSIMSQLPLWVWVGGAIVLGLAIAFGIIRTGQRTAREKAVTESATRDLYRREDR
jgi:hypothetical protein